jgi:hypothetical protein
MYPKKKELLGHDFTRLACFSENFETCGEVSLPLLQSRSVRGQRELARPFCLAWTSLDNEKAQS